MLLNVKMTKHTLSDKMHSKFIVKVYLLRNSYLKGNVNTGVIVVIELLCISAWFGVLGF